MIVFAVEKPGTCCFKLCTFLWMRVENLLSAHTHADSISVFNLIRLWVTTQVEQVSAQVPWSVPQIIIKQENLKKNAWRPIEIAFVIVANDHRISKTFFFQLNQSWICWAATLVLIANVTFAFYFRSAYFAQLQSKKITQKH